MKFGCCGNLVASEPDKTGIEIIETISQLGYDYIELPLAEMTELKDDEFELLKNRVQQSGISCQVCNNLFPAKIRLTGPDVNMTHIHQYLEKALKKAAELGADTVVFGSGTAKNVPEGFSKKTAYQQVLEETRLMAPIAEKNGITIVIEPIRTPECNLINSFEEGVALAKQVSHKNIKVLIDYYHMVWEKESPEILVKYGKEYLHHVHFSNPNMRTQEGLNFGRTYPQKMEEWDYNEFMKCLKICGYDGRISIEAGSDNFKEQAKNSLYFLKSNFI